MFESSFEMTGNINWGDVHLHKLKDPCKLLDCSMKTALHTTPQIRALAVKDTQTRHNIAQIRFFHCSSKMLQKLFCSTRIFPQSLQSDL